MKIDFVKISKIKNIDELKKYDLDEPYFLNNYFFHYLIMTNNLTALKLYNFDISKYNEDGLNGFHLAAKYDYYDILEYFISKYPKQIYLLTEYNENFLHFLTESDDYLKFIKKYASKINFEKLFSQANSDNVSPLEQLFNYGSYDVIMSLLDLSNVKFSHDKYSDIPAYFSLLLNKELKDKHVKNIFDKLYSIDKNIFSYVDTKGSTILLALVVANRKDLFIYLYEKIGGDKFNKYTPIDTLHIFEYAYHNSIQTDDYSLPLYIIKKIIKTHDFNETNKYGNNFAHVILIARSKYNRGNSEIEDIILSKYDCWDKVNMYKFSPIDYMAQMDFKYSKYLKNAKIDKKFKLNKEVNIADKKWVNFINNISRVEKSDIKMLNNKYSHGNVFQAKFQDICIYMMHFKDKYGKKLYIPMYNKKHNEPSTTSMPDGFLNKYNNFPWLIVWNSKDDYFIHSKLNIIISKNKDNYDYGLCFLSMRLPDGGLHATLVIYDFKRNVIERFDPYGNTIDIDLDMDNILRKELTINNKMDYYCPNKYFPVAGFQTLSDELNDYNLKMGDFGGYCLAWCLWYIEHRLLNNNVEPKTLIRKTINKFMKMNTKPVDYIRNYANNIINVKFDYLRKMGVPEDEISNELLTEHYNKKIYGSFIKIHNGYNREANN